MPLPEVLSSEWVWDAAIIPVLAVKVDSIELEPRFHGRGFKVRAQYILRKDRVSCETCEVRASRPPRPAAADFVARAAAEYCRGPAIASADTTFFFMASLLGEPQVRICLLTDEGTQLAASDPLELPFEAAERCYKLQLCAAGRMRRRRQVGHAVVRFEGTVELKGLLKSRLAALGASPQAEAFSLRHIPTVAGAVEDISDDTEGRPMLKGVMLEASRSAECSRQQWSRVLACCHADRALL